nr:hypothetical protein [Gemmatimonadota bacterium]NIR80122.1 hypothetical protein [Gemmatimonadota bacterium]NIT88877.1 hypothetical protein [Gemmatimonadota bacterium]NIU32680.1 hypothetical protein [Gemmatimonadota bacterium]NIU37116.1 hypothetical protein [Gemmatimonadota bacterium]
MKNRVNTLLEGRRDRLRRILGRRLEAVEGADDAPLTEERRAYLLDH